MKVHTPCVLSCTTQSRPRRAVDNESVGAVWINGEAKGFPGFNGALSVLSQSSPFFRYGLVRGVDRLCAIKCSSRARLNTYIHICVRRAKHARMT